MNHYFKLFLLLLFSWSNVSNSNLFSQDQSPEAIHVHFDKDLYITGEDIWYKIYLLEAGISPSQVIYVDLLNPEGVLLEQQKLKPENNVAWGDFFIPPDWTEGVYTFRAYTYWMFNYSPAFIYTKEISVYQLPEEPFTADQMNYQVPPLKLFQQEDLAVGARLNIQCNLDKNAYSPREKVTLELKVTDQKGKPVKAELSVAVRDAGILTRKNHPGAFFRQKKAVNELMEQARQLEEINFPKEKELNLRVGILNENLHKKVIGYLPSVFIVENRQRIRSELNYPPLVFKLPDLYGARNLQLFEFAEYAKDSAAFVIENIAGYCPPLSTNKIVPLHSPEIDSYLDIARERRALQQLFDLSTPSLLPDYPTPDLAGKADKIYFIDKFVSFQNIFDFIEEVVAGPLIKIKEEGKEKTLRLFNQDSNRRSLRSPVYLVNNYITLEESLALGLEWDNVERVELFNRTLSIVETFGSLGNNCGMALYTRNKETPEAIKNEVSNFSFDGYYLPRQFKAVNYSDLNMKSQKTPDFRSVEYWNPQIVTNKKGAARISFYTSDALSEFLIHIEGIDENGNPVVGEVSYRVEVIGDQ